MSEFAAGDRVAIYSHRSIGTPTVRWTTVERVTKTQYVLANGARYRKENLREVGVDRYRSSELVSSGDPRIAEAEQAQARQRLVNAVFSAWDLWHRDRRATPTALVEAAQALVALDQAEEST